MQHVVPELRSERGRYRDGDEQLSRIHGKSATEIPRCDSHDDRVLAVQAKRLPHRVGIGVEAGAPETIADDHNGCVAGLVQSCAEQTPTLSIDAEDGEIIGRYELSKDVLRL